MLEMPRYLIWLLLINEALTVPSTPNNLHDSKKLYLRDSLSIQADDPWDRRWIETLTAVGDSFSVGLGAGHAIKGTAQV